MLCNAYLTALWLFVFSFSLCRMSTHIAQSLFFLNLPDVEKLVCVTVSLGETEEEPRSKQIKTCR